MKAPFELVEYRSQYYKHVLLAVFKSLGIPTAKLRFVEGSSFQYSKEYTRDNFKMCAKVTEHDARRAGAEVVKQEENPLLSGLLYPGMQALDEVYLDCDFQFGGVDQVRVVHALLILYASPLTNALPSSAKSSSTPRRSSPGLATPNARTS